MKLTDLALIFIAILLPIVVLVYINTAFVVKSEKQEMYYKNMMNSATLDAVSAMKHIENEDQDIDYGYSGLVDNKVSINAKTAVDTFYNSLANNFNIANNEMSLERLKMYIPVIAILDYDGIYIHSAEEDEAGNLSFITKPKVHYTYSYVIKTKTASGSSTAEQCEIINVNDVEDITNINLLSKYIYEINYTMDDYIYLNIYKIENGKIGKIEFSKNFYLTDSKNNENLVYIDDMLSSEMLKLKTKVIEHLTTLHKQTIAEIGMREISYAVNKHNVYAKQVGINYTFRFSVDSDATWYETMDGIGMIAIIQGVSLGNRYLNYKAYSASDLIMTKKYYVSKGVQVESEEEAESNTHEHENSYLGQDLYHISNKCVAYLEYKNSTKEMIVPNYYTKKSDAATQGYYPCPICKP